MSDEPRKGTKVSCLDIEKDDGDSIVIVDDYVCVTDGSCYVAHTQVYANGTHILTIKGREGRS